MLDTADAVVLNVTAVGATAAGSVFVWPCGRSNQSQTVVFYRVGAAVAASAIVPLGSAQLCIGSTSSVHVIVDLQTQFVAGSGFVPARSLLVRTTGGVGTSRLPANVWRRAVPPAGRDLTSFLTVVARGATADGRLEVRGCESTEELVGDAERPALSFPAGHAASTLAAVRSSSGLCLRSTASVDVTIHLAGTLPTSGQHGDELMQRESYAVGEPWHEHRAQLSASTEYRVGRLDQNAFLPGWQDVAVVGLVSSGAVGRGHVVAYRCDEPRPATSVLNTTGATVSTTAFVELADDGALCLFATVAMVVDVAVNGGFDAAGGPLEVVAQMQCSDAIAPVGVHQQVWVGDQRAIGAQGWISGGVAPYTVGGVAPADWTVVPAEVSGVPGGGSSFLVAFLNATTRPVGDSGSVVIEVTDSAGSVVRFEIAYTVTSYKPIPVTC